MSHTETIALPFEQSRKNHAKKLLEEMIRSRKFLPGSKMPGERKLSEMFGVSYMTVRKAVDEMVARNWLERRPRQGTFVCNSAVKAAGTVVNLICDAYDNYYVRDFTRKGKFLLEKAGFTVRVISGFHDQQSIKKVLKDGSMSILLRLPKEYPETMALIRESSSRVLVIAERYDDFGCCSVIADERQIIQTAMEYLQKQNHSKIGIVCCNMKNGVERERYAKWQEINRKSCNSDAKFENRFFYLDLPAGEHPLKYAEKLFSKYKTIDDLEVDALICPDEETALAVLSVLRQNGIECPKDISVVAIGNNELSLMSNPRLTCVDNRFEEHLSFAVEWAQNMRDNILPRTMLHLCSCRIVERESVRIR